jgi:DMSO/TMAO reductase YedYZ molybdopterin-dependent catalytic subunit
VKRTSFVFGLLGILAALVGIAAADLLASFFNEAYAPIQVVASSAIDIPPAPVKEWATSTFGTSAKYVVVASVIAAVAALAFVAGVIARKHLVWSMAIAFGIGAIGAIAGLRRPTGQFWAPIPSLLAGAIAAVVLWFAATRILRAPVDANASIPGGASKAFSGRRALLFGTGAVIGSAAMLTAARGVSQLKNATASRVSTLLPPPVNPLPPLPPTVQAPVPGIGPFVTPNADFYRIDTAVVVPQVKNTEWNLTFDGLVTNTFTISYQDLIARPMVERDITIMCVSNPVGGPYIGTARWLGTPLMPLLEEAGIASSADQILSTSIDGWTCSTPLEGLADREPLLAIGMNGEPLPVDHGFPVRMIIPGLYGFISATKWVTRITATTYQDVTAYWTARGWATDAPVLTGSRIDVPAKPIPAGDTNIAGVAWAMDGGGISRVEVQIDGGPWQQANLAEEPNSVTWRQWWLPWVANPGEHAVVVRATNGEGEVQTSEVRDVIPSGATGYASRTVSVV